jgi:hypothetical protein
MNQPPPFRFRVFRTFKDCLTRQLSEAININRSHDNLLNSKNEYFTNCITRISVQEGALERKLIDYWNSRRISPGLTSVPQKKH